MKKLRSTQYAKHHILNPEFKYVKSTQTDVAATIKRAMKAAEAEREAAAARPARRLKVAV